MSKKILQLISADFEDLEVWYPVYRCREEGWQVDFAAEKPGLYHGKYGVPCEVSISFMDVDPDDYDGLLVPGGWAPDKLRRFPKVLDIRRDLPRGLGSHQRGYPSRQEGDQYARHHGRYAQCRRHLGR